MGDDEEKSRDIGMTGNKNDKRLITTRRMRTERRGERKKEDRRTRTRMRMGRRT